MSKERDAGPEQPQVTDPFEAFFLGRERPGDQEGRVGVEVDAEDTSVAKLLRLSGPKPEDNELIRVLQVVPGKTAAPLEDTRSAPQSSAETTTRERMLTTSGKMGPSAANKKPQWLRTYLPTQGENKRLRPRV